MEAGVLSPEKTFDWLQGEWSFKRVVSGLATMSGHARFVALCPDAAAYEETAVVQMRDGQTMQGSQQYAFVRAADGFAVYFPPGNEASEVDADRLFQAVAFSRGDDGCLCGIAEHCCQADVYTSSYTILRNGDLAIRHTVRGPRKDYIIETLYRKKA